MAIFLSSCWYTHVFSKNEYIQIDCKIISPEKQIIRNYKYQFCVFLNDGRMMVTGGDHGEGKEDPSLQMIGKDGAVEWQKEIYTHHIISLNSDKKTVAALGTETKIFQGEFTRFDILYKIDLAGNILNEWHLFNHIEDVRKELGLKEIPFWTESWLGQVGPTPKREVSHANSIYEIPENPFSKQNSAFTAGNFIVRLHGPLRATVIFDKDLKKILWVSSKRHIAHDVQVLPSGNILLYQNQANLDPQAPHFSYLEELNPADESRAWIYKANPPSEFYNVVHGSVQKRADGTYLFTDNSRDDVGRVALINASGKVLWQYEKTREPFDSFFYAKVFDLKDFLKNSTY